MKKTSKQQTNDISNANHTIKTLHFEIQDLIAGLDNLLDICKGENSEDIETFRIIEFIISMNNTLQIFTDNTFGPDMIGNINSDNTPCNVVTEFKDNKGTTHKLNFSNGKLIEYNTK